MNLRRIGKTATDTLQSKKHNFVRHELWTVAVELFLEHGFDEVTVDQIAQVAGISRRTFFRYFASKDDLMGFSVKEYGTALCRALDGQTSKFGAYMAGKRAVSEVLAKQLSKPGTERFMQITKRSPAALSAQSLPLPMVEAQISRAFAKRAGRVEFTLEDRIAASLTFAMTKLCVEIWVEDQDNGVEDIVNDLFSKLSEIVQSSEPR